MFHETWWNFACTRRLLWKRTEMKPEFEKWNKIVPFCFIKNVFVKNKIPNPVCAPNIPYSLWLLTCRSYHYSSRKNIAQGKYICEFSLAWQIAINAQTFSHGNFFFIIHRVNCRYMNLLYTLFMDINLRTYFSNCPDADSSDK